MNYLTSMREEVGKKAKSWGAKGESRLAKLIQMLIDGGRNEDVRRAAVDPVYREQLYVEANL